MSVTNERRRAAIREYLMQHGSAQVGRLSQHFDASEATIRRDIIALLTESGFKKFRGGISVDATSPEPSFAQRSYLQSDKKRRIGKKAAELRARRRGDLSRNRLHCARSGEEPDDAQEPHR